MRASRLGATSGAGSDVNEPEDMNEGGDDCAGRGQNTRDGEASQTVPPAVHVRARAPTMIAPTLGLPVPLGVKNFEACVHRYWYYIVEVRCSRTIRPVTKKAIGNYISSPLHLQGCPPRRRSSG